MCVIIVAKSGIKVPMENLKAAWHSNSDGAGMSYIENGVVRIRKGFMKFEDFVDALRETPVDTDRMFHFRIATAGKVIPGICHPYPVEQNFKAMYATDMLTNMACAHNGVITWCNPPQATQATFSDSMSFISGYLYPLRHEIMTNTALQEMVKRSTSSKFAVMTAQGVITIGDFIELGGVYYSNSSWRGGYYCVSDADWDARDYYGYHYRNGKFSYTNTPATKSTITVGGKEKAYYDDEYIDFDDVYSGYTQASSHKCEKEEDTIEGLKAAAKADGTDDPCVLAFYAQDLKEGLNFYDAEQILDCLLEGYGIKIINCDFDEIQKVLYLTVEWDEIPKMPNTVANATWSVVC